MTTLFCVRPATRNIGNDVIHAATAELLRATFGGDVALVNIPALAGPQFGGLTAKQVYDMNRFADGVVLGGGNLLENGQLTVDRTALEALRAPVMTIGLSHGRIHDRSGGLVERTDALPADVVRLLFAKARVSLVRNDATAARLAAMKVEGATVSGCPTLFLPANPGGLERDDTALVSVRHPSRMSVPPATQWRVADDLRRIIAGLKQGLGCRVVLACHDYADIEFASGLAEAPLIYFDDVERYMAALRRCRVSVGYRLHAFLPCLAFGTPSIHISYDERGRDMVATAGMAAWDIDLMTVQDVAAAVMSRAASLDTFQSLRRSAQPRIQSLRRSTEEGLRRFREQVLAFSAGHGSER